MKKSYLLMVSLFVGMALLSCKKSEVTPEEEDSTEANSNMDDSNNSDAVSELLIQTRLDNGVTPLEIYKEDASLLDSLYGKSYEGGLIVYLNTTNGSGLVSMSSDLDTSITEWGCLNTVLGENIFVGNDPFNGVPMFQFVTYAINENIGGGESNTEQINETCLISAALLCEAYEGNGYDDWFMPSRYEMEEVAKALGERQSLRDSYWTSTQENTQSSAAKVYAVNTSDNSSVLVSKFNAGGRGLRAVREF